MKERATYEVESTGHDFVSLQLVVLLPSRRKYFTSVIMFLLSVPPAIHSEAAYTHAHERKTVQVYAFWV